MFLHRAEILDPHLLGHLVQFGHGHRLQLADVDGVRGGQLRAGSALVRLSGFRRPREVLGRFRNGRFLCCGLRQRGVFRQSFHQSISLRLASGGVFLGNSWHKFVKGRLLTLADTAEGLPTLPLSPPEGKIRSFWRSFKKTARGHLVKNQYGKGNLAVNSRTRWRTFCVPSTFLMSSRTSLTMSAMAAISGSFMPRVVTAGVPNRTPLA